MGGLVSEEPTGRSDHAVIRIRLSLQELLAPINMTETSQEWIKVDC